MIVHKCDACGKIFEHTDARFDRVYKITKTIKPKHIGDKNMVEEVDICDYCYDRIADFLKSELDLELC